MAKAIFVRQVPVAHDVQLTLSPEEAATLAAILDRVGGCTVTSRRRHAASMRSALTELHIESNTDDISRTERAIYFK